MRILLLANAASPHTARWAAGFARRGHEVHVVSIRHAEIDGAEVHRVGFGGPASRNRLLALASYLRLLISVRRIRRRLAPDVVHAHYSVTHGAIAVLARLKPVVLTVWGSDLVSGDEVTGGLKRWLNRLVLRRVALVTAASEFLGDAVGSVCGSASPVRVVPFGVDTGRFQPGRVGDPEFRVGFIKHLRSRYGPDVLVEAFALFRADHPQARLLLAGPGPMRSDLERRVSALALEESVEFLGAVDHSEVPALMATLDVLANPSRSESFGVVLLEAAATGIPVVATRVGGTAETVIDEVTGLLVGVDSPADLAAALNRLAGDPALRDRMGAAGRAHVLAKYEWSESLTRMEAVLAEVTL